MVASITTETSQLEQIASRYRLTGRSDEAELIMRFLKGELIVLPLSGNDFRSSASAVGLVLEAIGQETAFNGFENETIFFQRLPSGATIGFEFY